MGWGDGDLASFVNLLPRRVYNRRTRVVRSVARAVRGALPRRTVAHLSRCLHALTRPLRVLAVCPYASTHTLPAFPLRECVRGGEPRALVAANLRRGSRPGIAVARAGGRVSLPRGTGSREGARVGVRAAARVRTRLAAGRSPLVRGRGRADARRGTRAGGWGRALPPYTSPLHAHHLFSQHRSSLDPQRFQVLPSSRRALVMIPPPRHHRRSPTGGQTSALRRPATMWGHRD